IKKARSGTRVIVLPGTYHGKYVISKQADPNNPIIISGIEGLTVFACGHLPENKGDAPLKFSVAKGLILEHFRFESCWPAPIEVTDSTYLIFRNNAFKGGHNAIKLAEQTTHSIQIANNAWNQDETKERVWKA